MIIRQFKVGEMDNFCYIIADEKTKQAAIIDPGWEPETVLRNAEGYQIQAILLTHTHFDHVRKIPELVDKTNAKIYVHSAENYTNFNVEQIEDSDLIKLGNLDINVIHVPGHSPGSVCYLIENNLFTGDTLFVGGIGRTDFRGGDSVAMENSLKKLSQLPAETIVWPGHDYGSVFKSTIGKELIGSV